MLNKKMFYCGLLAVASLLYADNEVELNINGDFRGAAVNASTVPGWSISQNGKARVVATKDPKEFALELQGTASAPAESKTDFYPVWGNLLTFDAELAGRGKAIMTVYFFDASKQLISSCGFEQNASTRTSKFKRNVPLVEKSAFIQLGIAAAANSTVRFADVEAEFKMAAVSPAATASAMGKQNSAAATENMIPLADEQKLRWEDIQNGTVYSVGIRLGKDIDIDLGEPGRKVQWKIQSADPKFVYAKIEHETSRTLGYKAELEIKGLKAGISTIVLSCGEKTITIRCNIL